MIGTLDSPFQTPSEPPSWPHYPPFSRVGVSSRRQASRRLGLDSWHRPCNDHLGLIESTNNYWVSQRMNFPKIGSEEKTTYQIFRQWPTKNDRLKCTHHPSNSPFGAKSLLNSSSSSHRRSQSPESLPQSIGEGADAGVESRWALEMGRARVLHRCPVRRVRYRTRTSCMIGCVDVDGDEAIMKRRCVR